MSLPHWFSLIWKSIFFSLVLTKGGYSFFFIYLSGKFQLERQSCQKKFRLAFRKVPISLVTILVWQVYLKSCLKNHESLVSGPFWFFSTIYYVFHAFGKKTFLISFFLGFLLGRRVSAALSDSQYLSRDLPVIFNANRFNRNQISSSEILHMLPAYKNRESGRGALVPRQRRSLQNGAVLSSHRDCYRVRMRVLLIWLNLTILVAFLSEKRSQGQK